MLPDTSFAVHRMIVFPSGNVFDALFVIVTCWISVAVALPIGTVLSFSEVASKVMLAGMVSFGGVVFCTSIIWVVFALFPDASVAVQVTVVLPNGNTSGALLSIVTGSMSATAGFASDIVLLLSEVASKVMLAGMVSFGGMV